MPAQRKYPEELHERAVKMVFEVRDREGNGRGELARVARQLGVHPDALRKWVRQMDAPVTPQHGFCCARRSTTAPTLAGTDGRPACSGRSISS
jgi:transposase-like protein